MKAYADAILEGCFLYTYDELVALNYILKNVRNVPSDVISIACKNSDFQISHPNIPYSLHSLVSSIQKKPITAFFYVQQWQSEELSLFTKIQSRVGDVDEFTVYLSAQLCVTIKQFARSIKYLKLVDFSKFHSRLAFCLYYWASKKLVSTTNMSGIDSFSFLLNVDEIKLKSALHGKYDRWDKFKDDVLSPAIESINHHTDILLKWAPVRTSRRVTAIEIECCRTVQLASKKE